MYNDKSTKSNKNYHKPQVKMTITEKIIAIIKKHGLILNLMHLALKIVSMNILLLVNVCHIMITKFGLTAIVIIKNKLLYYFLIIL